MKCLLCAASSCTTVKCLLCALCCCAGCGPVSEAAVGQRGTGIPTTNVGSKSECQLQGQLCDLGKWLPCSEPWGGICISCHHSHPQRSQLSGSLFGGWLSLMCTHSPRVNNHSISLPPVPRVALEPVTVTRSPASQWLEAEGLPLKSDRSAKAQKAILKGVLEVFVFQIPRNGYYQLLFLPSRPFRQQVQ